MRTSARPPAPPSTSGRPKPARGWTREVITEWRGSWVTLKADIRLGTRLEARYRHVRVTARGRGIEAFRRRAAIAVFLPTALWIVAHLWVHRSFDGMLMAFADALLDSALEGVNQRLFSPREALLSSAVGAVAWWIAFGFPKRRP